MVATLYINRQGSDSKNQVKRISKSLESAKKSIKNANDHLYNVVSSRVRTERESLTSIYNKDNTYESNFDDFANKLESCINELIQTDKDCATKIKRNGQSHRKANGLPKSLVGAAVNASFTTLGNIVDGVMDDIEEWVSETIETLKNGLIDAGNWFLENWDSIVQFVEGSIQVIAGGGVITIGILTALGVLTAPVAPWLLAAGGITFLFGLDKVNTSYDKLIGEEGATGEPKIKKWLKDILPDWAGSLVYNVVDATSFAVVTGGISGIGGTKIASGLSKVLNAGDTFSDFTKKYKVDDVVGFLKDVKQDGLKNAIISNLGEFGIGKVKEAIFGEKDDKGFDEYKAFKGQIEYFYDKKYANGLFS